MDAQSRHSARLEAARRLIRRLAGDQRGVAVVEYSLILGLFSITSGIAFMGLQSVAQGTVTASTAAMQSYGVNPLAFECASGVQASCR